MRIRFAACARKGGTWGQGPPFSLSRRLPTRHNAWRQARGSGNMGRIGRVLAATAAAMIGVGGIAHAAEPVLKDQGDRYSGAPQATRSAVLGANGMAATSQPLATQIALDVLKAGGSAVDAAIAANAALGLMEPTGNGIGGDLFAIVWDPKTAKLHGLNGSGRAPRGQTLAQLKKANGGKAELPPHGWLPVTIPGTVDA